MTQVRKAYPQDPSKIPLQSSDGKQTTLGAMAPKVLLVSLFTSRFGDLSELKMAPHLLKVLAGNKDVAFIALNEDRPKTQEDWDTLRQVLKEGGVDVPLYADTQLSFLAWVNGPPTADAGDFVRVPGFAIVLNGKQLHATNAATSSTLPDEYVAERLREVNEALQAVGAKPVKPPAEAKPVKQKKPASGH